MHCNSRQFIDSRLRHRRGAFAVVVLVCLLIAGMVLASLVRLALIQDRQSRSDQWRIQAGWLAESGLSRAASRLAADPKYPGETWEIGSDTLHGESGVVVIQVQKETAGAGRRLVIAEAAFPAAGPEQARRTRQVFVTLSEES
jgi:Tfp pilus assembly protein PilX